MTRGDEMKLITRSSKFFAPVLTIALLVSILLTVTACEEFGYPATDTSTDTEPEPEEVKPVTTIRTKDTAELAVYQRLLDLAESYEAKLYLSDFYTTCDNWSAESEYFKDGSAIWHVKVDMTNNTNWTYRPYWQIASWFIYKDGKVIPSNLYESNALRIEADLQALSPESDMDQDEED